MGQLLWIDTAEDKAIDLGDFFLFHGAFAEMTKLVGKEYDTYKELFGVPLQVSLQEDCDPHWLEAVRVQSRSILHEYDSQLSDTSKYILENLIRSDG